MKNEDDAVDRNPIETQLKALDRAMLAKLVQEALGSETVEIVNWYYQAITQGTGAATGGVYRIVGIGQDQGKEVDWSFVLKVVCLTQSGIVAGDDLTHPLYWKREVLAYQSGLLHNLLPTRLTVPRCFAIIEQPDQSFWLWLEDVQECYGPHWPLEQYMYVARLFGHFNGAYLTSQSIPAYPWLTGNGSPREMLHHFVWLRDLVQDAMIWQHPLLRSAFPVSVVDRLLRLWADRDQLLDLFEQLPQTLCHLDAWRGNLVAPCCMDKQNHVVIIDWSYVGRGIIATDASDLMGASFSTFGIKGSDPRTFATQIFEHYLAGLREQGWYGDRRIVYFAFAVFAALKYGCLLIWLPDVSMESKYVLWERSLGHSMEEFLHQQAALVYYLLDLIDEARGLMETVSELIASSKDVDRK